MKYKRLFIVTLSAVFLGGCAQDSSGTADMDHSHETAAIDPDAEGHQDHNPRHGGQFSMALDYFHHLEITLNDPNTVRIYLYNQYTEPLPRERMVQASGTLHIGDFPDPPAFELEPARGEDYLEATLEGDLSFPQMLTLLIRFPGSEPGADPELFNFYFEGFSVEGATEEEHNEEHSEDGTEHQ